MTNPNLDEAALLLYKLEARDGDDPNQARLALANTLAAIEQARALRILALVAADGIPGIADRAQIQNQIRDEIAEYARHETTHREESTDHAV